MRKGGRRSGKVGEERLLEMSERREEVGEGGGEERDKRRGRRRGRDEGRRGGREEEANGKNKKI